LTKIVNLAKANAVVAVLSVSGRNEVSIEAVREGLARGNAESVETGEEILLKASEQDQSYLPEREGQMQFRLNFFKLTQ
jgi:uncharacterized phosphosugar-binding protein